jgi:hypothetical protein
LLYPPLTTWDIPFPGQLNVAIPIGLNVLRGNATFFWNHEGTFSPSVIGIMKSGQRFDFGLIDSVILQVLPKQTVAEMQMNKLNLVVAYAILILSALGVVSILIDLWVIQPSENANSIPDTTNPSKENITTAKPEPRSTKKP